MTTEFSEMEQSIIKNMMLRKSHKDIVRLLDCDLVDLSFFISEHVADTDIITWQMKLDLNKPIKRVQPPKEKKVVIRIPKPVKQPDPLEKERMEARKLAQLAKEQKSRDFNERMNIERQRAVRRREPQLKTKDHNFSAKVSVRIDRCTVILVKPGEEEKAKKEFMKFYKRPIDRFGHSGND